MTGSVETNDLAAVPPHVAMRLSSDERLRWQRDRDLYPVWCTCAERDRPSSLGRTWSGFAPFDGKQHALHLADTALSALLNVLDQTPDARWALSRVALCEGTEHNFRMMAEAYMVTSEADVTRRDLVPFRKWYGTRRLFLVEASRDKDILLLELPLDLLLRGASPGDRVCLYPATRIDLTSDDVPNNVDLIETYDYLGAVGTMAWGTLAGVAAQGVARSIEQPTLSACKSWCLRGSTLRLGSQYRLRFDVVPTRIDGRLRPTPTTTLQTEQFFCMEFKQGVMIWSASVSFELVDARRAERTRDSSSAGQESRSASLGVQFDTKVLVTHANGRTDPGWAWQGSSSSTALRTRRLLLPAGERLLRFECEPESLEDCRSEIIRLQSAPRLLGGYFLPAIFVLTTVTGDGIGMKRRLRFPYALDGLANDEPFEIGILTPAPAPRPLVCVDLSHFVVSTVRLQDAELASIVAESMPRLMHVRSGGC